MYKRELKMRKKPCIAVMILCMAFLLSGCKSSEYRNANVINANNYDGVSFETTSVSTAAPIPESSVTTTSKAAESTAVSEASVPVSEESEQTTVPVTEKSEQTTSTTAAPTAAATSTTTAPPAVTSETEAAFSSAAETTTTASGAAASTAATEAATDAELPDYDRSSYKPLNYSEVKGIWISYIELAGLLQGQSKEGFRKNIAAVYENCADLGINTVYVHVRSHGDAYYRSELFPWSKYVTGTLGKNPGYDPLDVMISEAHKRGISFHAWINPLRACSAADISSYGSYPVYTFAKGDGMAGKYAVNVNGTYYLNPAYSEVTDLIAAGAAEIVANYDVDGLHIDDYFYPTTDASFDSAAYSASGYSSLSDFRFANCDRMVSGLYSAVHSANSTAKFSVSTQGRIENNYNQLYADVRKWCTTPGYADIMIQQIYYGFENSAAPYQSTLDEWDKLAKKGGIPLIAGLSVSKVGCEDTWAGSGKYEWINNSDIISRQTAAAKKCSSYGGVALYSYRSVFQPESSVSAQVKKEITALREIL